MSSRNGRNATLADVAARAKVSSMTVSRVINRSGYVGEQTRRRVEKAMEAIGYVPNQLARGLVVRRLGVIALVVADVTHPWFTTLAHTLEVAAGGAGLTVVLGNSDDDPEIELTYLKKLTSLQVEGIVIAATGSNSTDNLRFLKRQGIPFVLIDRKVPGVTADLVQGESYRSAITLVEHLIDHGHKRIAMISGPSTVSTSTDRVRGYRQTMKDRGLKVPKDFVRYGPYTREAGEKATTSLFETDSHPTAIFAANGFIAFGVLDAAKRLGLKVPEDLAIVTFDDVEATAVDPFFTCMEQPAKEVGRVALDLLMARLAGEDTAARRVVLDNDLRIRQSCGCKGAS